MSKSEAIIGSIENESKPVLVHATLNEFFCPKCGLRELTKGGFYKIKQQYQCKGCQRHFFEESKPVSTNVICHRCGSKNYIKNGFIGNGKQQYQCKNCKRYFLEGYIPPVDKTLLNIACHRCGSKNYQKFGFNRKRKRQRYWCKDCEKCFFQPKPKDAILNNAVCNKCGSKDCTKAGFRHQGTQLYRCKQCKKYFLEGAKPVDTTIKDVTCIKCGSKDCKRKGSLRGRERYWCRGCKRSFYDLKPGERQYKDIPLGDDVWSAEQLGLKSCDERGLFKISFLYIKQDWFKTEIKKYVRLSALTKKFSTISSTISIFRNFSNFLDFNYPSISRFQDISRETILDYIIHLRIMGRTDRTIGKRLGQLKQLFETGNLNGWFSISPHLIRSEDIPKKHKRIPRFIPEEVMHQLNSHLDDLPAPIMRMVLTIQETGLRIGELVKLPIDCLRQSDKGGYFIQYTNWKMQKDDTKPISIELAEIIKEQQLYIHKHLNDFELLFCARNATRRGHLDFKPIPKIMGSQSFGNCLKNLAKRNNICDKSGRIWNFQTHQFRHTVATRMINTGVPLHIIQRFLSHESPDMTSVYAHIHDETLREEIEKYHETRTINFKGETVELEESSLSSSDDLEWFTHKIQARALEHGYCGRPKILGDCDIPGFEGCYVCPYWRTNENFLPILEETLKRTDNVIQKARQSGWDLQVKKNEPIQKNLKHIIEVLNEKKPL